MKVFQIADLLKQYNIAVILQDEHALPATEDDDVDQPFKTPAILQKAGVLFALNDEHGEKLVPQTASSIAGDLPLLMASSGKEQALQLPLRQRKYIDVNRKTGSLEAGKDANIDGDKGDILDMRTSIVVQAFIQGRLGWPGRTNKSSCTIGINTPARVER